MGTATPAIMRVDVEGIGLHAVVRGEDGNPVLLLHGLGGSAQTWEDTIDALAGRHVVIAPDLRGSGRSDAGDSAITIDLLADDVVGILDALDIATCHVVGHSLGGVVAQSLLVRHTQRCRSAVLISTSCRVGERARAGWLRLAEVVETRGLSSSPTAQARAFSEEFARARPEVIAAHAKIAAATKPSAYAALARAASDYDYTDALAAVEQPVLVVQGLADRVTSPGGSVILSRTLRNARLELIDGVGHNLQIEMVERFVSMLEAFFAEV